MIGKTINSYKVLEKLGKGGNADVFLVEKNNKKYAMKFLIFYKNSKPFKKKYERFKREINIVKLKQNEISGIIPIIDDCLPNVSEIKPHNRPWYVMELGTSFKKIDFVQKEVSEIVSIVKNLAITLENLHTENITHRDIKPSNLYFYKGEVALGDFGLVDYPEAVELTQDTESVGPKFTIAPEMKRNPNEHDNKAADVYSLAKTLWIFLTGNKVGFEGQYSYREKSFNLLTYREGELFSIVNRLLEKSTSNSPSDRPKMKEFRETLEQFLSSNKEEKLKCEWDYVLSNLFPYGIPKSLEWDDNEAIVSTLNELTLLGYLNHMFMPTGGGLDLEGVRTSNEPGYIELDFGYENIHKCKPKRLYLETFENSNWNYFYLELKDIKENLNYTGEIYDDSLEVVENEPGEYIEYYHWNYKRNMCTEKKEPLHEEAREITLALKGNFCIFNKWSPYNSEPSTYCPFQTMFSPEGFKQFILKWIENPQVIEAAKKVYFDIKDAKRTNHPIDKKKITEENVKEILSKVDLNSSENLDDTLMYSLRIQNNFNTIKIDNKLNIIFEKNSFSSTDLSSFLTEFDEKFYSKQDLLRIKNDIESQVEEYNSYEPLSYTMEIKRIKSPIYLFKKEEIKPLILQGDSLKYNGLVINSNGELELINSEKHEFESQFYPAYVKEFNSKTNSVGEFCTLTDYQVDNIYVELLNYWLKHLSYGRQVFYVDYFEIKDIQKLEKMVNEYY